MSSTAYTPESMETLKRDVLDKWAAESRNHVGPTRESWMADLLALGAVDSATARELTRNGCPNWPWIPPFELDQVDELVARSSREDAELLRRAAKADLEPPRPALAEAAAATRPSRELPAPRPERSTKQTSRRTGAYSATRPRRRTARSGLLQPLWLAIILCVVGLLALIAWFATFFIASPEPNDPLQGFQPETSDAPRELRDSEALDEAVARLIDALEETAEQHRGFELRELVLADLPTLDTLGPADQRRRPEVARIVLALAVHRSGLSFEGLAHEVPLFRAVACGWLGPVPPRRDPACDLPPPIHAVDQLIRDLESEETGS